jgi:hypothetical protein
MHGNIISIELFMAFYDRHRILLLSMVSNGSKR